MNVEYLLDTNVVSELLKPEPNVLLVKRWQRHETNMAIPSVVWHELLFGCYRLPSSRKRDVIQEYLTAIRWLILPYDDAAADWHAGERARLMRLGKTPAFADGQIAAIAATQGLTLVTFNVRDFALFQGLKIVDWRQ